MLSPAEYFVRQRWLPCKEVGGLFVPAFSLVECTGSYTDGTLKVRRPTSVSIAGKAFFTGPVAMQAGDYGQCTRDYPCLCLTTDSTLGFASAQANSYVLANSATAGFWVVLGSPVVASPTLSYVALAE